MQIEITDTVGPTYLNPLGSGCVNSGPSSQTSFQVEVIPVQQMLHYMCATPTFLTAVLLLRVQL